MKTISLAYSTREINRNFRIKVSGVDGEGNKVHKLVGVFFAFSNQQFGEGYKRLIELGHIKKGDKVLRGVGGAFGTKEGLDKFSSSTRIEIPQ